MASAAQTPSTTVTRLSGSLGAEVRGIDLRKVDKADIEFPNDLLVELDRMEFFVYETGETIKAKHRPIIIITSNNEKELPDAFLRRCFFHFINFPDNLHFVGVYNLIVHLAGVGLLK